MVMPTRPYEATARFRIEDPPLAARDEVTTPRRRASGRPRGSGSELMGADRMGSIRRGKSS